MKRLLSIAWMGTMCLSIAACGRNEAQENRKWEKEIQENEIEESEIQEEEINENEMPETEMGDIDEQGIESAEMEEMVSGEDLVGPWHLDAEKNDLVEFMDRFPGYMEFDASMEIKSDGLMSWYIGAIGWHGRYTVEDKVLSAEMDSDLEPVKETWVFRIVPEKESFCLEMDYEDITVYWIYGDREQAYGDEK